MQTGRTQTLSIRTPEGISFSLLLASPVSRFLAYAVDLACISALSMVIGIIFAFLNLISLDLAQALPILAFFVLQIGYGILSEWRWRGQTIGKRVLRLRVVDAQGLKLQFSQIAIRNLLRFIDMLPAFYLIGGVVSLFNARAQRLGDLAANTVVIRNPKVAQPDIEQLLAGKYNSFSEYPHLEARLRQNVSAQEAGVALQALLRRDQLEPSARIELFSEIATHFRKIVEFPPEVTEGITDEQYVRNVVDVLFRSRSGKKSH